MTRACRQRCSGGPFDHEEIVMSIAKAHELLRCPICRREVPLPEEEGGIGDATPGVDARKTHL
ncbi:hypothetical protein ACFQJD_00255 [Haloplanus sp. GCM10025708]|uniref:hypothetical protein n=1 Tax=Haloplanus sp. GCM10025708 TaxID=3252679 RepID=UPI00360803F7